MIYLLTFVEIYPALQPAKLTFVEIYVALQFVLLTSVEIFVAPRLPVKTWLVVQQYVYRQASK